MKHPYTHKKRKKLLEKGLQNMPQFQEPISIIDLKKVRRLHYYVKEKNYTWYEGMSKNVIYLLKHIYKLKPKYYFIEGQSYILHKRNSLSYYCVTKDYWDTI